MHLKFWITLTKIETCGEEQNGLKVGQILDLNKKDMSSLWTSTTKEGFEKVKVTSSTILEMCTPLKILEKTKENKINRQKLTAWKIATKNKKTQK